MDSHVQATRYCIVVLGTNAAATGRRDIAEEFVWVTDVYPPKDLVYADPPLFLVKDEPMVPMVPTVTTADCSNLKSVANTMPQYNASDCQVQHYDIQPPLPTGLSLDPQTGVISGTPTELLPRPEIFLVTATNGGGKSSAFISLAVIGNLRDATLSSCLRAPTTSELVLSFRTPSEADAPWLQAGAPWPQMLRLRLLRPLLIALRRTTGAALDFLSRSAAIGCGSVVLDATSDAPEGFPPPTLCHWQDSQDLALGEAGAVGARLDMQFQGNATMENDRTYQITFKARLSQLASAGDELLQLTLFASDARGRCAFGRAPLPINVPLHYGLRGMIIILCSTYVCIYVPLWT
ncbi:ANKRD50 [Symbiodinium sp. CCMP2456]|nr:ANKRD50 [Symbiodinium sp. CCMP2456]